MLIFYAVPSNFQNNFKVVGNVFNDAYDNFCEDDNDDNNDDEDDDDNGSGNYAKVV